MDVSDAMDVLFTCGRRPTALVQAGFRISSIGTTQMKGVAKAKINR
jgi:hypothetical protein